MKNYRRNLPILLLFSALLLVPACGGGGGGSSSSTPPATSKVLYWDPATAFVDNTPMNPLTDLDRYLVYVNTSGTFSPSDTPVDSVSAILPNGAARNQYSLGDLSRAGFDLSPGTTYHVTLAAVSKAGVASPLATKTSFTP